MSNQNILRKVVVVGQALPMQPTSVPFERTRLFDWFSTIGISKESALRDFAFTALVSKFPGKSNHGHRAPSPQEIQMARPLLIGQLVEWQPEILLPVGLLAIRESICEPDASLVTTVGHKFL